MKRVALVGATAGAAVGLTLGYLTRMAQDKGYFEQMSDKVHDFALRTKKRFKDAVDTGQNELEYMKDKAEYEMRKNQRRQIEVTEA